jgi:hypothetical protein
MSEAPFTGARVRKAFPQSDPQAPMRGILLGIGISTVLWIVGWSLVL